MTKTKLADLEAMLAAARPGGQRASRRGPALRPDRHRRQAQRGQVHADERAGRPEDQHHQPQGADHAPPHHRHPHARRHAVRVCRYARLSDQAQHGAEQIAEQDRDGRDRRRGSDPVRGRGRQLHPGRRQGLEPVQARHPHAAHCQQARHRAPPRRDRALAQEHAGAPPVRRVRAHVGQEARTTSSACTASAKNTCPSSPGGTPRTS